MYNEEEATHDKEGAHDYGEGEDEGHAPPARVNPSRVSGIYQQLDGISLPHGRGEVVQGYVVVRHALVGVAHVGHIMILVVDGRPPLSPYLLNLGCHRGA